MFLSVRGDEGPEEEKLPSKQKLDRSLRSEGHQSRGTVYRILPRPHHSNRLASWGLPAAHCTASCRPYLAPIMKRSVSSVAALASAAGVVIWCLSVHRRRRKQVEEPQKLAAEAEKTEEEWLRELKQELYASVMPFWMDHSVDKEHGGFFSCLDRHGGLFDADKKYIWLNGRAVWMTSELVRSTSDEELRAMSGGASHKALLEACIKGADFLLDHALILDDGGGGGGGAATAAAGSAVVVSQAWFCLNADGSKPVHLERKPFSAMFLCQGVANTARLLKERGDAGWVRYASGAAAVLEAVRKMVSAPETLGRPSCPGAAYKAWNVPMIFLSVLETFADGDDEFLAAANGLERAALEAEVEWCVDELLSHMVDSRVAVENVGKLSEENNEAEAAAGLTGTCRRRGKAVSSSQGTALSAPGFSWTTP